MNWIKKYICTLSKSITILFGVSTIFTFVYGIYLKTIPAIFYGADTVGEILNGIALSIIAGCVVYFLSVHKPDMDKKYTSESIVYFAIDLIFECKNSLLKKLQIERDFEFHNDFPTENEWKELEQKNIIRHIEWKEVIEYYVKDLNHYFKNIYLFHEYHWNVVKPIIYIEHRLMSGMLLSNYRKPKEIENVTLDLESVKDFIKLIEWLHSVIQGTYKESINYDSSIFLTNNSKREVEILEKINYKFRINLK